MGFLNNKPRKKFGEIAVKNGFVSQKQLVEALKEQHIYMEKTRLHKKIGSILNEKGILTEEDIHTTLKEQEKNNSIIQCLCNMFNITR